MKSKTLNLMLALGALLSLTATSPAATGIFGSYVEIWNGATSTIYKGENFSSVANFQGATLGSYNISDTLLIGNSQIDTFKNGGGDVFGGEMQYRVYKTGNTPGTFNTQPYSFQANATYTDLGGMSITGFGDQAWGNTNDINLLSLAVSGNGEYTIELFFKATSNEGDKFSNNGGNNFKATFNLIPEPSTYALVAVGLCGLVLLRRRAARS